MTPRRPMDFVATLHALRPLTPDVAEVVLNLSSPENLEFRPGQFLNLQIPQDGARPLIRAYSIVGLRKGGRQLVFAIDTEVPGPGVSYLLGLRPGDTVQFKAPLGIFVLKEPADRPVLIVTHVSALAMCLHFAEAALEENPGRSVTLIAEVKDEAHLFYHKELLELSRRAPAFRHVLTRPDGSPAWTGPRRSLLEETLRRLPTPPEVDCYVVGLGNMVATLKEALKKAGVPAGRIVVEKWSKADGGEKNESEG